MIKKTLQPTNDMYLQFTEEELQTLNMKPGDKFDVKHHEDGSIELRPYVKMEIDMEDWPREALEEIIKQSCEEDISANEVIANLLKQSLEKYPTFEKFEKSKELLLEKAAIDPNFTNNDTSIASGYAPCSHKEEYDLYSG